MYFIKVIYLVYDSVQRLLRILYRCYNEHYCVLLSATVYYRILLCTTEYYCVLQNIILYYRILMCTTEYYFVLQSTTVHDRMPYF